MPMSAPRNDTPAGWPVLHLYYRVERARWRSLPPSDRGAAVAVLSALLSRCAAEEGLQLSPMAGVAKSDVGFMAIHPDLSRIQQLGQEIAATALGACLTPVYDFLSISESSEYISTSGDW